MFSIRTFGWLSQSVIVVNIKSHVIVGCTTMYIRSHDQKQEKHGTCLIILISKIFSNWHMLNYNKLCVANNCTNIKDILEFGTCIIILRCVSQNISFMVLNVLIVVAHTL